MTGPRFYRVTVDFEAWQWDGSLVGATEIIDWVLREGGTARYHGTNEIPEKPRLHHIAIDICDGTTEETYPGDWIVRGITGGFFRCKPMEFEATYQEVGI